MILPDLATKSHAELQTMVEAMHAELFVWSLMGQDAGQPLDKIIMRAGRQRPRGRRAAEKGHERAALHLALLILAACSATAAQHV